MHTDSNKETEVFMRGAVCILLSFMLLFTLSVCDTPEQPYMAAWWGLMFPQMFAQPDGGDQVTFTWPFLNRLLYLFRSNG